MITKHNDKMSRSIVELLPNIYGVDLALIVYVCRRGRSKECVLIIGDLHIGYEEAINKKGVLLPRQQLKDIIRRLDRIFKILSDRKVSVAKVIINGDLKHEFGVISDQEWRDTLKTIDYLKKKSGDAEIILIRGNHDTILGPIAGKRGITISENYCFESIYICHGNNMPKSEDKDFRSAKNIVIGHIHPSVTVSDGARKEKYKAFVVSDWKKKKLIMMPSFCTITYGFDIIGEEKRPGFLSEAKNARVFISADRIYDFGPLDKLKTI